MISPSTASIVFVCFLTLCIDFFLFLKLHHLRLTYLNFFKWNAKLGKSSTCTFSSIFWLLQTLWKNSQNFWRKVIHLCDTSKPSTLYWDFIILKRTTYSRCTVYPVSKTKFNIHQNITHHCIFNFLTLIQDYTQLMFMFTVHALDIRSNLDWKVSLILSLRKIWNIFVYQLCRTTDLYCISTLLDYIVHKLLLHLRGEHDIWHVICLSGQW